MDIYSFVNGFKNHPVLFIGAGFSLRYLKTAYTWEGLLRKIYMDLYGNDEEFYNKKDDFRNSKCLYQDLAENLENSFNKNLKENREGKFKSINDIFFEKSKQGQTISRFKIYISELLKNLDCKEDKNEEIEALKAASKNIGTVITTNYDKLLEKILNFDPIVGNDLLLTNPYGSIYKIHGSVDEAEKIIITKKDYENFESNYALIKAQLLSLFVHHPIIFIGYGIGDPNIQDILRTIFSYVKPNSETEEIIKNNFLFIEYSPNNNNLEISDYAVSIDNQMTVRISMLKTDNYIELYNSLAKLTMHVSVMEIRKVQSVLNDICFGKKTGNTITVRIANDIDALENSDYVLAMGSPEKIKVSYDIIAPNELIQRYFEIMEEGDGKNLSVIDKLNIQSNQYFPIYGFSKKNTTIDKTKKLKEQQEKLIVDFFNNSRCKKQEGTSIEGILSDDSIANSYKNQVIMYSVYKDKISLKDLKDYLISKSKINNRSDYNKMIALYDYKKYKD